jgi:hypothetical protein
MGRVSFTGRRRSTFSDTSVFSYIPSDTASHFRRECTQYTECRGVRAELHLLQISAESSRADVTVFVVLHVVCRQIAGYAASGSAALTSATFQSTVYQSVI